ncbi:MAG: glycoside hydrolase family 57 protein [Bacteroidales bacterium]|nr:glycoside hydrolase family 57 protein [Bacteroidales bacterium]
MATKSICLYFQVHQPTRLRLYRFFDIGKDSHYYDDFANRTILRRIAQKCYLPMNAQLLNLIKANKGKFKVAFSISGSALEQFQRFAPDVIDSFRALAETGCVEFLCETYYHSLASLASPSEFEHQVLKHKKTIEDLFGVTPTAFRNTELIYSNAIGEEVYNLGFKTMLTEGARHIMGWQSPNFVYSCDTQPKLRLLLRNYGLSDDIAFRFSNQGWDMWPLTAEKYLAWVKDSAKDDDIVNLFMDYETFGEHQSAASGIFDFMKALPDAILADGTFSFVTPSEATKKYKPVADLDVPDAISWADEERDVTAWLGNELQQEAFNKVYAMTEKLSIVGDPELWEDFGHLQESDHFYYMCTKFFSDGEVHKYFNPYDTPYEAFINYMNVISDFQIRLDEKRAALDVKKTAVKEVEAVPVRKKPATRKTSVKKK